MVQTIAGRMKNRNERLRKSQKDRNRTTGTVTLPLQRCSVFQSIINTYFTCGKPAAFHALIPPASSYTSLKPAAFIFATAAALLPPL